METGFLDTAAVCLALFVSCAGLLLFRISGSAIKAQPEDETKVSTVGFFAKVPQKYWQTGMFISNLLLAVRWALVDKTSFLQELRVLVLCTVLWVCAWTDCRRYVILNKILFLAVLVFFGILAVEAVLEPENFRYTLSSACVPAVGLLTAGLLCRAVVPKSVGFGDLKLFIVIGLYLGVHTWNAVFYTLLASFIVSVALLATKRATKKTVIPFAPFLLLGMLLASVLHGV